MNNLYVIASFHMSDGKVIEDSNMLLEAINEKELFISTTKRKIPKIDNIEFTTIQLLYGNKPNVLIRMDMKEVHRKDDKTFFVLSAPKEMNIKLNHENRKIKCEDYFKLINMLTPRTGKSTEKIKGKIEF